MLLKSEYSQAPEITPKLMPKISFHATGIPNVQTSDRESFETIAKENFEAALTNTIEPLCF